MNAYPDQKTICIKTQNLPACPQPSLLILIATRVTTDDSVEALTPQPSQIHFCIWSKSLLRKQNSS